MQQTPSQLISLFTRQMTYHCSYQHSSPYRLPSFEEQWKNLTLEPKIPNVRKRLQTKVLKDITNKETAKSKQPSAHTSVISYNSTNQASLPSTFPSTTKVLRATTTTSPQLRPPHTTCTVTWSKKTSHLHLI
jgi:hypothetical protein